ncbi:MAG: J domain-containing protein, partial [Candidatus Binatia bacterium]
ARGRTSQYYWEICRTGRRRGVTPEYVVDRASVLLASIEERRRTDIYRIFGVPPLSSDEAIRHRWLEVAKQAHPDAGGDPAAFRQAKEAYEILRDPARRAEYERFWLRAVGPIARLTAADEGVPAAPVASGIAVRSQAERRVVIVAKRTAPTPVETATSKSVRALQQTTTRFAEARERLDRHLAAAGLQGLGGMRTLLAHVEQLLLPVAHEELVRARGEVEDGIARLEALQVELATLAGLKRRVGA